MAAVRFTFFFGRDPVGYFDRVPDAPGHYRYEAFRGPGHYDMCLALESDGTAHCLCRVEQQQWVEFDVMGESDDGELLLENIATMQLPQGE